MQSTGTALITGASGGIGYELAKLFARDRYDLVLVARHETRLNQVASELEGKFQIKVKAVALDLAETGAARILADHLHSDHVAVDVLVNNAGFGLFGAFAGMEVEEILGQIQLNITSLTQLTRLLLPGMLARRHGKIMNVASTAAFQPGPLMAVYYASKAYVLSFSEALANEVAGSGVVVNCFCPGATDTSFQKRAGLESSRLFKRIGAMKVERVASDGYRGLMAGRNLVISGFQNWLAAESVRFAPRKLVTAVSRWVAEKVD
jgi:short-subunit dehydrogenase